MRFKEFKNSSKISLQLIQEVKINPGELRKWASSEEAQGIRAGFEAEMYFRDTGYEEEQESEPDYDQDERARDIESVVDFFQGGENGIGRNQANRLRDALYEQFHEWVSNTFYEDQWSQSLYTNWVEDAIWRREQNDWRNRAADHLDLNIGDELTPKQTDQIEQTAQKLFQQEAEDQWENQGPWYNEAEEALLDEFRDDTDEAEWLDNNYRYMSDIESEFNLDWPYWTNDGGREGGSRDPDDIARSLSQALGGARVVASPGYQRTKRRENQWIVEPDGSLNSPDEREDSGLEIISPPMPLDQTLIALRTVVDWANGVGDAYTNETTGLHIGVSLPYKGSSIDYVKLILFMGDRYVLEKFDRAANGFCRSALEKLQSYSSTLRRHTNESVPVRQMAGQERIAAAMDLMRKNLVELAERYVKGDIGLSKYTSAHIKDGYIEFRSPGGDYLSLDSRENGELENTMLRFARAMHIAGRPDLERKEYSKKLYKLLSGFKSAEMSKDEDPRPPDQRKSRVRYQTRIEHEDQNDALELFARYSSGMIDSEELKKKWAEQVLAKEQPAKPSSQEDTREYEVVRRDTGEVISTFRAYNDQEALEHAQRRWSDKGFDFSVREKTDAKPEKTVSRRAEIAKRIKDRPTVWHVENTITGKVLLIATKTSLDARLQAERRDPEFALLTMKNPHAYLIRPATADEYRKYQEQQRAKGGDLYLVTWQDIRNGRLVNDSTTVRAATAQAAVDFVIDKEKAQGRQISLVRAYPAEEGIDDQKQDHQQAPGRGWYRVSWTEFRNGRETPDSIRQEGDSAEDAIARIRRALGYQGRTPANMRAEPEDSGTPPTSSSVG
jgi:hypothetical protein